MDIPKRTSHSWTRKHDNPDTPLIPSGRTIYYPQSLEHVIEICRDQASGNSLKAVGRHWSLSEAAVSDEAFIETNDPDNVFPVLGRTLREVVPGCLSGKFWEKLKRHPEQETYYIHVEAGKRICQLYAELDSGEEDIDGSLCKVAREKSDNDTDIYGGSWALPTMGGGGGQTIVGALATGTHGGDFDRGPLYSAVVAMHLVVDGGKHLWLEERDDHFTDEAALHALYGKIGVPDSFEVKYDHDMFQAALVQVGRMGVIYSVVLKVTRQYELLEDRKLGYWNTVKEQIREHSDKLFKNSYLPQLPLNTLPPDLTQRFLQISLCLSPCTDRKDHRCGVTKRYQMPSTGRIMRYSFKPGQMERVGRRLSKSDPLLNAPRFQHAGLSFPFDPESKGPRASVLDAACANASFVNGLIDALCNELADFIKDDTITAGGVLTAGAAVAGASGIMLTSLLPFLALLLPALLALKKLLELAGPKTMGEVMDLLRGVLLGSGNPEARKAGVYLWRCIFNKVFEGQESNRRYTAISYAVMDGHNYFDKSCNVNVDCLEVFFPALDTNLVTFVDLLLDFEAEQQQLHGRATVGYISLRFMYQSQALLGEQAIRGITCSIECGGLLDVAGSGGFVDKASALARRPDFNAILHWGQRNDCTREEIERRFNGSAATMGEKRLSLWRSCLAYLTENGRFNRFSNEFTRRTGLEIN